MKTVYIERNKLFEPIQMILFNEINEIDENFMEDNFEMFYVDCENCIDKSEEEREKCEECMGEGRFDVEFYQYFITDADKIDVERLKEYGVRVGYSEKLDKYIIGISDFGTSWSAFSYSKEVSDDYILSSNETLKRLTVY